MDASRPPTTPRRDKKIRDPGSRVTTSREMERERGRKRSVKRKRRGVGKGGEMAN